MNTQAWPRRINRKAHDWFKVEAEHREFDCRHYPKCLHYMATVKNPHNYGFTCKGCPHLERKKPAEYTSMKASGHWATMIDYESIGKF